MKWSTVTWGTPVMLIYSFLLVELFQAASFVGCCLGFNLSHYKPFPGM